MQEKDAMRQGSSRGFFLIRERDHTYGKGPEGDWPLETGAGRGGERGRGREREQNREMGRKREEDGRWTGHFFFDLSKILYLFLFLFIFFSASATLFLFFYFPV